MVNPKKCEKDFCLPGEEMTLRNRKDGGGVDNPGGAKKRKENVWAKREKKRKEKE